jgi:hypothetical protein
MRLDYYYKVYKVATIFFSFQNLKKSGGKLQKVFNKNGTSHIHLGPWTRSMFGLFLRQEADLSFLTTTDITV